MRSCSPTRLSGLQYRKLPPIHDITTDPIDPPRFEALARLRASDGANTAVYAGLYSAEQQRQAYPDIEPIQVEIPAERAYALTLALVNKRKWLVIDERPPQPPRRIGRIEAVARTPIMGFREDVSIRIMPDGDEFAGRYPFLFALFRERPRLQRRAGDEIHRRSEHGCRNGGAEAGEEDPPPPTPKAPAKTVKNER